MWLLPVFSPLSRFALRVFYRLGVTGERVPQRGPVLLVANHPNSLLDPAAVVAVAGRPVRFLAKAPLFSHGAVGWLVRGSGAIPVYRRQDGPAAAGANDDTFRAVQDALAAGAAVGIFPEGISHTSPALAPLKTGAARIALGAAARTGGAFPVVPVGLVFRDKEAFRSEGMAVVGEPVAWDDLAARGEGDRGAVQELTARIAEALERVTINLERWEDAPLLETAEAIYSVEIGADPVPAARVRRMREAAAALARLRQDERGPWRSLAREVAGHARALRVLGMTPEQLKGGNRTALAAGWLARQAAFFALGVPVAALGTVIFFIPYRLTRPAAGLTHATPDMRATTKLLIGSVLHLLWIAALAALVGWRFGPLAGLAALLALPAMGIVTLHVRDRWRRATGEARRFILRARRRATIEELRTRQRELAARLHAITTVAR
ncbi:MAG: 1-acyl-sn-glycerol-3-phosphate acyltransferase [uncultured Gemmatimonadetes bacterium]|uniref:1-acyl-sn-glycerol-3-phosphate acyltransferase n=1 Tax=uncultured Gemmatimonadota bacterium TaxID=203437 RepID=A0A6J4MCR0_9BACT|nr:MAG: 1-acyl-sn-glycerol-3-phosphate acyltransferase [uncultured Gemmatimonadota bacterium]